MRGVGIRLRPQRRSVPLQRAAVPQERHARAVVRARVPGRRVQLLGAQIEQRHAIKRHRQLGGPTRDLHVQRRGGQIGRLQDGRRTVHAGQQHARLPLGGTPHDQCKGAAVAHA